MALSTGNFLLGIQQNAAKFSDHWSFKGCSARTERMSFWNQFLVESMQSPWMIGSTITQKKVNEPKTQKVFIVTADVTDSQYEMVAKMILALKYQPEEVTIFEVGDDNLDFLKDWHEPKKILLFGKHFTNQFGNFINLFGSQLMSTHSLLQLENDIELKKQTWQHLKKFKSLK